MQGIRVMSATATIALAGALTWSALGAPLGAREARWAQQGYGPSPTATPTPGPSPTPTATPITFGLTPRPTSAGLVPRPPTPTPQAIVATPGPCTIAIGERSATCMTAYYQPVTWTLGSAQVVTMSSLFDATSRAVFVSELRAGAQITIAPRWQPARVIPIITLTGQISGSKLTPTALAGFGPPGAMVTLVHHRWISVTNSYRASFYTTTASAQGAWALNVPGGVLGSPRDYWQVRYVANGVTYVNGILTRRLFFPSVRRQS